MVVQTGLTSTCNFELPKADQASCCLETGADAFTRTSYWDDSAIGLERKPAKVPTVNLVIDHGERPSANERR
jgi:hypothetical protein